MANSISDKMLNRQIKHLTKYLPDQSELQGVGQGANFHKQVNERSFVEAYKMTYKNIVGLQQKFHLTPSQKSQLSSIKSGLLDTVEKAFCNMENPPANFENFLKLSKEG